MFEVRQTNQFAEVISLILGIVNNYIAFKMKEAVDVAIQLQTNKLREEAQAENQEFLNQRGRDDQDKDEDPSAGSNRGSKRRRSGKEAESSKEPIHKDSKSTSSSKGASKSQPKYSGKSAYAEEHGQKVDDLDDQTHQEFNTRNDDVTPVRETLEDSKVPDEQQQKVSSTNEGAGVRPEVPYVPKYDSKSDKESWTFSQDENDADEKTDVNDDSEKTKFDNDGDDLTHPNLSTYKAYDEKEEEEKADDDEEVSSDEKVSTPPEYELIEEEEE
nr:hypothetical protein [Tanacetum cinerariifolium]